MNNKILSSVKKYNMLSYGDRVLAGVSGGADSVLLLNFLLSVKEKYNLSISVAHIEHGIRGRESIDDALFVKSLCDKNDVPFHLLTIDAVNEAKSEKMSVEEYSRKKRYAFFNSIDCDKIATAHNLTDNIETLLFRLSRGTGLKGACAIPPVRGKIIRPLIEISSAEIRNYCSDNNITYRIDSTNNTNAYSRNYIRNIILPDFSELNDSYENNFLRFISSANEDNAFIEDCAEKAYLFCLENGMLNISRLKELHISVLKRVLIKFVDLPLDELHINEILTLLKKKGKIQLKGSVFAVSNGDYLRIADFSDNKAEFKYEVEILNISEFHKNNIDFYCDYDKIIGNVSVRSRIAGDTVSPAGRGCTKSLKKLYNEYGIPVELRSCVPVITDDNGVIGIAGYCVDERVKADSYTKQILTIKLPSED